MAEKNVIKKADLARIREQQFVWKFEDSIKKLIEALGVTRKIPKVAGTNLKAYKATGLLEDGSVPEGDTIPLSKYQVEPVTFAEITIKKWRKATTVEAITERGFDQAVTMTTTKMIDDAQKGIKKDFFGFLAQGTGKAYGSTFQACIAQVWGQLQVLFEDTDIQAVYFMNPLDVADYLGTANISTQTAFGMVYIEDFMGLGTVILNGAVPKGTVYGTAKENIVLYYIPVNGADVGEAFTLTSDETGYIGIHESPDYDNMTCKDTVVSGIVLFAERIDGVIVGKIGSGASTVTLNKTTASVVVDEKIQLVAKVAPVGTSITWASSDDTKATVDENGVVTGVAAGTANITATSNGVTSAPCVVTVSAGA